VIFVLGGKGFVGSAFARVLKARGFRHEVIGRHEYERFIGRRCDLLINVDGNSRKFLARERPIEDFDASVRSVRASLSDFRFGSYLLVSSTDVYPDCSSPNITRENQDIDPARQSPYGFHKYLAELTVRHAAGEWFIGRLGGVVGPGMWKNPVFDILNGGPLWLDPDSELQFLSTDAAAGLMLDLVERGLKREIVNIAGRGVIGLREIMNMAGRKTIEVKPGSPKVRYDVSVDKLSFRVEVPDTRRTISTFLREHITGNVRVAGSP